MLPDNGRYLRRRYIVAWFPFRLLGDGVETLNHQLFSSREPEPSARWATRCTALVAELGRKIIERRRGPGFLAGCPKRSRESAWQFDLTPTSQHEYSKRQWNRRYREVGVNTYDRWASNPVPIATPTANADWGGPSQFSSQRTLRRFKTCKEQKRRGPSSDTN